MNMVLWTSAAIAVVCGFGLMASVDAEEPAGPGEATAQQAAGAPQDPEATVVTPEGGQEQAATVQRQQVRLRDGATVSVLRPVAAPAERAPGPEEDVRPETQPAWQVAAGWRLWLIDPASGDLRTCAVRQTSTVGVEAIRCFAISGAFGPTFAP